VKRETNILLPLAILPFCVLVNLMIDTFVQLGLTNPSPVLTGQTGREQTI
jgi:hypothetical protein